MEKVKQIFDWFKTKKACAIFALMAFVGGISFLNLNLTGNVILEKNYYFNFISLIGILLVVCSLILVGYIIKNK